MINIIRNVYYDRLQIGFALLNSTPEHSRQANMFFPYLAMIYFQKTNCSTLCLLFATLLLVDTQSDVLVEPVLLNLPPICFHINNAASSIQKLFPRCSVAHIGLPLTRAAPVLQARRLPSICFHVTIQRTRRGPVRHNTPKPRLRDQTQGSGACTSET